MHRFTLAALAAVVMASGLAQTPVINAQSGKQPGNYGDGLFAEVQTNKGLIVLQLEFEKTPMTVMNFVGLAEGTIENKALPPGTPFFDGSTWHRVVAGHVIQTGMPKATERGPGYTIPNEIDPSLNHGRAGMLGMANSGPHTNSSQFYITLADRSYLDGIYTVFGHVVAGLDVVNTIVQGDTVERVRIIRSGSRAAAFKSDNATFLKAVEQARERVKADDERKAQAEDAQIKKEWPNALTSAKGARYVVLRPGTGDAVQPGRILKVVYVGRSLGGRPICSSADEGRPVPGTAAQPFDYEMGKTKVTPGLDEVLLNMRKGEKRTVIVQGPTSYGSSGFFAREKPGEKRFVIPPNTTLVYEVELLDIR
ncbi:MAG: peptidylprolyl isomerase [Acidobacteria bacterium]|nr:peptidylprolyl isomerase [Acidobacteriota bacterium]